MTGRGRPRSFDRDGVVDEAMALFWSRGFEGTSIEDVTKATGVNPSSIYAAFGNKLGLFQAALDRYEDQVGPALTALAIGARGLDDVRAFLRWVLTWVESPGAPGGCLIVNTMAEFSGADPDIASVATRYRERVRAALEAALTRAERLGEIEPRSSQARATVLQAGLFGAFITARAGANNEAGKMVRGLTAEVRRWVQQQAPHIPDVRAGRNEVGR